MIETVIIAEDKPKMKDPILVAGLPGVGNVGRVAIGYLIHELKAKKFADLYSPYFYPFVMIHNDVLHTLRNEFYYYKGKKDIIFLIGDCQTYDPKGHYEVVGKILDFARSFGCKEIITMGGFATGKISEKPKVLGAVTDPGMLKKYKKYNINFKISDQVGTIVGASGLLAGLGSKLHKMKGLCLLGETSGFPIFTDPNAAESVLEVLQKILNTGVDLSKLKEKVKEMYSFIKRLEELQQQAVTQLKEKKGPEELRYIG